MVMKKMNPSSWVAYLALTVWYVACPEVFPSP